MTRCSYDGSLYIAFTRHALKRTRKRFKLCNDAEARRFIRDQITSDDAIIRWHSNARVVKTPIATMVTRPLESDPHGIIVVTCYPSSKTQRRTPPHARPRTRDSRAAERRALQHLRRVEHLHDLYQLNNSIHQPARPKSHGPF